MVRSVFDQLIQRGLKCEKYCGTDKENEFKKKLERNTMLACPIDMICDSDCHEEFAILNSWSDTQPTLFQLYIEWEQTKGNSKSKATMKITEAVDLLLKDEAQYNLYQADYKKARKLVEDINKINLTRYICDDDSVSLKRIISTLQDCVYKSAYDEYASNQSIILTNKAISILKDIASRKSNTVSKPGSTGFSEYVNRRIALYKATEHILECLNTKEYSTDEYLGELEDKGTLRIRSVYRMLCKESRAPEFNIGINALKNFKGRLLDLFREFSTCEIANIAEELKTLIRENNIQSILDFVGMYKKIVNEDGFDYSPSNGEQGILLMQSHLDMLADAYILDEPELGMGNSYIDSTIRPKLVHLAQCNKVVVIATHNANIAVRTLPYLSVLRTHENGIYKTYTGNPFIDVLSNIENETDTKSWTDESMHTLEGGREAFYERKSIYESSDN